jgi:hypothetical protein
MTKIIVFGNDVEIVDGDDGRDFQMFKNGHILVARGKISASNVSDKFLDDLLYSELIEISDGMRKKGIEILGDLDFVIVDCIDNRKDRIAKLKGKQGSDQKKRG